jgi:hypothetical protein
LQRHGVNPAALAIMFTAFTGTVPESQTDLGRDTTKN